MNVTKQKAIKTFGECRCCGERKNCAIYVLSADYELYGIGITVVYSRMLKECLNLTMSGLDAAPEKQGICQMCVTQLRKAAAFREQVQKCEAKFRLLHGQLDPLQNEITLKKEEDMSEDYEGNSCDDEYDMSSQEDEKYTIEIKPIEMEGSDSKTIKKPNITVKIEPNDSDESTEKTSPNPENKKVNSEESTRGLTKMLTQKRNENAVVIVENSYVCPFTSAFSDYFCSYCKKTFTNPTSLREHTLQHDPRTFRKTYRSRRIAQIDIDRIDCRRCSEKINDIDTLKTHIITHGVYLHKVEGECLQFKLKSDKHTCLVCDKNFNFFHALRNHMAEHFGTKVCKICSKKYFKACTLKEHEVTHKDLPKEKFVCKYCGKIFLSKGNREVHEKTLHKNIAAFPCSFCEEGFASYHQRYRHMVATHDIKRSFPCEVCGKEYDTRRSVSRHYKKTHLKIKEKK